MRDDRHAVGEVRGLVQVVRGEQDRGALGAQLLEQRPELPAGGRVETRSSARRGTAPPGGPGRRARRRGAAAGRRRGWGRGCRPTRSARLRRATRRVARLGVVARRSAARPRATVSSSGAPMPWPTTPSRPRHAGRRAPDRTPSTATSPPSRRAESFQDLDGGGLARAVRAEQREALAGRDVEVEAVDDRAAAVALRSPARPVRLARSCAEHGAAIRARGGQVDDGFVSAASLTRATSPARPGRPSAQRRSRTASARVRPGVSVAISLPKTARRAAPSSATAAAPARRAAAGGVRESLGEPAPRHPEGQLHRQPGRSCAAASR